MKSTFLTYKMYEWWKYQLRNIRSSDQNNLSINEEIVYLCSQGVSYSLGFRGNPCGIFFLHNFGLEEKFKDSLFDSINENFKDMPMRERALYGRVLFKPEVCLEYNEQSSCNLITVLAKMKLNDDNETFLNDLFESIRSAIVSPVHKKRLSFAG